MQHLSSHTYSSSDQSSNKVSERPSSGHPQHKTLSAARILTIYRSLIPLTLSNTDSHGHILQLWKAGERGLVGSVIDTTGKLRVVYSDRIVNPLANDRKHEDLTRRLQILPPHIWSLVFDPIKVELIIWPKLLAAAKHGQLGQLNRYLSKLSTKTLSGAARERIGAVVMYKPDCTPYDHNNKIDEFSEGLDRHIKALEAKLTKNPPKIKEEERAPLQSELTRAIKLQKYVALIAKVANPRAYYAGVNTLLDSRMKTDSMRHKYKVALGNVLTKKAKVEIREKHVVHYNIDSLVHRNLRIQAIFDTHKKFFQFFSKSSGNHPDGDGPSGGRLPRGSKQQTSSDSHSWRTRQPRPTLLSSPSFQKFGEVLQKTGLVSSYNSTHSDHPIPPKGTMSGEIGGVGSTSELLLGLFDDAESIFETNHLFFIPTMDNDALPMTNQELQQILRELTVGIYVYDTIPFFSLHFNAKTDLYPVIHPAYSNTLVGKVISHLDYFMKGYLNGGVFTEKFIKEWEEHPYWESKKASAQQNMIDFSSYCQEHLSGTDAEYTSLRQLLDLYTLLPSDTDEPPIFRNFSLFSNSFRIIAKQKNVQKADNLLILETDFDVLYTIDPAPEYKNQLEQYQKLHGVYPPSYRRMVEAYELMKTRIHDHMVKLPMCAKYFKMLGVINSLCSYLTTLKKHRKVPLLPSLQPLNEECSSPNLFPHLPLNHFTKENLYIKLSWVFFSLFCSKRSALINYLTQKNALLESELQEEMVKLCMLSVLRESSPAMQRHLKAHPETINTLLASYAVGFLKALKIKIAGDLTAPGLDARKIIEKFIWDLSDKPISIKDSHSAFILHLPSEIPQETRASLNQVVGGCGLSLQPLQAVPSLQGEQILQNYRSTLQQLEPETWMPLDAKDENRLNGAIFKVAFVDLPSDVDDDYLWMEALFTAPNEEVSAKLAMMEQIGNTILNDDEPAFQTMLAVLTPELGQMRDRQGKTLVHIAAMQENTTYLQQLLEQGLAADAKDRSHYIPVHYAAMYGHINNVDILLKAHPSSLNTYSDDQVTPLAVAIQHGQREMVQYLLRNKASYHTVSHTGYTALHSALHHGYTDIVLDLLEQPYISIHERTEEGVTPLMLACEIDSEVIVQKLLSLKANPQALRKDGVIALDIAVARRCVPICRLLIPVSSFSNVTVEIALKESSLEILQLLSNQPQGFLTNIF